ncbi:uncharacterized protein LOC123266484 [Cotesia glomerata]|uniref:uncharacterized protein LOC123266484 n=1 Tax=Cotesia glomerata TaxID=32391 RepID=UPI001D01D97A|nr:uncharacterized protein LOC123266484 [Cotesia glomerata]
MDISYITVSAGKTTKTTPECTHVQPLNQTRKEFVHATLSPMALMFPSPNWRFMYDWMKTDEKNNQEMEASALKDKIWNSFLSNSSAYLASESKNLPNMNRSECNNCDAGMDKEITSLINMTLPTYAELYEYKPPIDIEAGKPVQMDVAEDKIDQFIKKYLPEERKKVPNWIKILAAVSFFLGIVITILEITLSFGVFSYIYPYF